MVVTSVVTNYNDYTNVLWSETNDTDGSQCVKSEIQAGPRHVKLFPIHSWPLRAKNKQSLYSAESASSAIQTKSVCVLDRSSEQFRSQNTYAG